MSKEKQVKLRGRAVWSEVLGIKGREELVNLYCLDQYVVKLNYADERLLEGKLYMEIIED